MPPTPKSPALEDEPSLPRRRGRPDRGVRREYRRVEIAFPPDVHEGIARLADRRQTQTGRTTRRADIVREAVVAFLRENLPEAGL